MRRDVMENSGLADFAEISIIIFFAVFLLILARAIFMSRGEVSRMLQMPLHDGAMPEDATAEDAGVEEVRS